MLDLRKLNFLDSAGLGRVLAVQRRATRDGRRLVVVRGCRAVERLFALTRARHAARDGQRAARGAAGITGVARVSTGPSSRVSSSAPSASGQNARAGVARA